MAKSDLKLVTPTETVTTSRGPRAEARTRKHLTQDEVKVLVEAALNVRRVKNGTPSTHPLLGDEMRALRRLQQESDTSPFVFVSERGSPFTTAGFARIVERAAAARLELKAHPHMLREACGYALANRGYNTRDIQVWLGHRFRRSRRVSRYLPSLAINT